MRHVDRVVASAIAHEACVQPLDHLGAEIDLVGKGVDAKAVDTAGIVELKPARPQLAQERRPETAYRPPLGDCPEKRLNRVVGAGDQLRGGLRHAGFLVVLTEYRPPLASGASRRAGAPPLARPYRRR